MHQLYVCIYLFPLGPPSQPTPYPIHIYVITEHRAELLVLYSRFPLSVLHVAVHICQILFINACESQRIDAFELWSW